MTQSHEPVRAWLFGRYETVGCKCGDPTVDSYWSHRRHVDAVTPADAIVELPECEVQW